MAASTGKMGMVVTLLPSAAEAGLCRDPRPPLSLHVPGTKPPVRGTQLSPFTLQVQKQRWGFLSKSQQPARGGLYFSLEGNTRSHRQQEAGWGQSLEGP